MDVQQLRHRLACEPQSVSSRLQASDIAAAEQKVEQALAWQAASQHHFIVTPHSPFYPPLLAELDDAPTVLFCKGEIDSLVAPSIALVGSRDASRNGLQHAYDFGRQLAELGLVVVSGMAAGIDGAAHQGCLMAGGRTLGVLGTGVEQIYPKRHRKLYDDVMQSGCLISEFWPDVKPYAGNFPKRNRIISGLSLGTLVIEARRKSGSLITARLASEQGREVFALPGSILAGDHQGCHDLIKNGAKLVDTLADIVEELPPLLRAHLESLPIEPHLTKEDSSELPFKTLLASVGYETTAVDVVVANSGIAVDLVLEQLLELELQGFVAAVPGGYVRLKRS
ncbi:DNA-processing protein DprA [Shewanella avicenniae]|uniref:DNA-processing protein DprA n=1 Tax=Shewanella avicenniae TaxID=2814294 RepID=A0ABX7QV25_9GAMM|nr:DNA-processing protein DprA [Shewanella avicenniae]QSX35357.1 DNA-processing protein DprA [Shewanella avicenniae]